MSEKIPIIRRKKRKIRGNKKLLILLAMFFISVFVLVFFQSPLSKVSSITVSGNHFVSEGDIVQRSELNEGDSYFRVDEMEIIQRVEGLEFVESVQVDKHFPGHIQIEVLEYPHVAFEYVNGEVYAVLANAQSIKLDSYVIPDKPILSQWQGQDSLKLKMCYILANIPDQHLEDVSEILPDPSSSYEDRILLYTRSGFEVVTTISKLAEKLSYLNEIILELEEEDIFDGRLILLEADTHVPFSADTTDTNEQTDMGESAEETDISVNKQE